MEFITLIAGLLLLHFQVVEPIRRALRVKSSQAFQRGFRQFQLHTLVRHYRALEGLSFEEIERRYDVDALYHDISWPPGTR